MAYDLTQALAELATLTANGPATTSALMNLVRQVSVEASGSVTVLYSGNMPDGTTRASTVVQDMLSSGQNIRVLDESAAGKFWPQPRNSLLTMPISRPSSANLAANDGHWRWRLSGY